MGNSLSSCCKGTHSRRSLYYQRSDDSLGRPKDSLYEPALQDSEREAVADLLQYLEQVSSRAKKARTRSDKFQRNETDFFSGEPLRALSTLVYSDNVDLQRSASLTFAEITERGMQTFNNANGKDAETNLRCPRSRR